MNDIANTVEYIISKSSQEWVKEAATCVLADVVA
jgi:hypothetical protein